MPYDKNITKYKNIATEELMILFLWIFCLISLLSFFQGAQAADFEVIQRYPHKHCKLEICIATGPHLPNEFSGRQGFELRSSHSNH